MKFRRWAGLGLSLVMLTLVCGGYSVAAKTLKKHHGGTTHAPADPVDGLWLTEGGEGGVELYSCGPKICGRFYWLKDDEDNGDISRDTKNPDPDKRARPLCGTEFMTGFVPDGKGHYADGSIYSPRHGADFSAEMTLADHDTLRLRGYLLFSFLGETQTWKRARTMPKCAMVGKPSG